jgi:YVTN family beta-propeller protein
MRFTSCLLLLGCIVSLSTGQWVETTILLPDPAFWITDVGSLLYHAPNDIVYLGGLDTFLVAVDAHSNTKHRRLAVGAGPHALCSNPPGNKVYCANSDSTITVVDGATNQPVKTFSVERIVTDLVYCELEDKLYCGSDADNIVRVIDCAADSVVAEIPVYSGPIALCHNPQLNRVYCAHANVDDVTVVDCSADTVVTSVWTRGVRQMDICYDSATNCVYTPNYVSNTVSVIDCSGDTLARVVSVGSAPVLVEAGPPGKVYCANSGDSSVSVLSEDSVNTVVTGWSPIALSFDPVNGKVYCADYGADRVTVIDAAGDTVVAQVVTGWGPAAVCYNPTGNNTYVACTEDNIVSVIDGASNQVEASITFSQGYPGLLCYNTTSDRLYCADDEAGIVYVIDGNTNRVRTALDAEVDWIAGLLWNPFRNKTYVTAPDDSCVCVIDGATDQFVARIGIGAEAWPEWMCYNSANDKVYVAGSGTPAVYVIDCADDSVVTTAPTAFSGGRLAYNSVSNKVYCVDEYADSLVVISGSADTVVRTIALPYATYYSLCFVPPHNKLYLGSSSGAIHVVDGAGDSLVKTLQASGSALSISYDLGNDRVYATVPYEGRIEIYDPACDSLVADLWVGYSTCASLDNGRSGEANRVYAPRGGEVAVISGATDSVIRVVEVGSFPVALAWNPAHSWMYVANYWSSSITVVRDTLMLGVEGEIVGATREATGATIVRGVLNLQVDSRRHSAYRAELLDISGRKVMDLDPGANDVRALAPGVYFVRDAEAQAQAQAQAVRKVVVTR